MGLTMNDTLDREIKRAAKSVAFQWPGVVEAEDIENSIWLHLLERPNSHQKLLDMDDTPRYRAVVGIGHQLASQERTDYDHFKGSYNYSVDEVKKLLARGVLVEPLEGVHDSVIDLMDGLESMVAKTPQYVEAITKRYADNEVPQSSTASSTLSRSLTRLANAMNKSSRVRFSERDDGIGTRAVVTNAEAQFISKKQYRGEDPDWEGSSRLDGIEGGTGWSAR